MKYFLIALLLTACAAQPTYALRTRMTLLHGSDVAIQQGCVRGVIRWEHDRSGEYPALAQVALFCEEVQRSFQDEMGEGNDYT